MSDYYSEKLSGRRLKMVYDIAPPRVQQYLQAEVDYVISRIHPGDTILELGCGYGRILPFLSRVAGFLAGIDTSLESLLAAREIAAGLANCHLAGMDAIKLGFPDHTFDRTVCIQNGISAFHVDQRQLLCESLRVTKPAGTVLFSSYSEKFWKDRLDWFEQQARYGLLGEIDYGKTGDGAIICRDGFTATTVNEADFRALAAGLPVTVTITEIDQSSLFCELVPKSAR